ncbi:MAG: hypothetical protein M1834_006168 [Cirrosporium novae-zelandiae]|nr:MAG: hypothetical protein M1834_006168 [Cirrosporium novae-zelandiae]
MATETLEDYYKILDLDPNNEDELTPQKVKQAYHRALLKNHPDKLQGSTSDVQPPTELTIYTVDQITQAFKTLSNPQSKAEYDRLRTLPPAVYTGNDDISDTLNTFNQSMNAEFAAMQRSMDDFDAMMSQMDERLDTMGGRTGGMGSNFGAMYDDPFMFGGSQGRHSNTFPRRFHDSSHFQQRPATRPSSSFDEPTVDPNINHHTRRTGMQNNSSAWQQLFNMSEGSNFTPRQQSHEWVSPDGSGYARATSGRTSNGTAAWQQVFSMSSGVPSSPQQQSEEGYSSMSWRFRGSFNVRLG